MSDLLIRNAHCVATFDASVPEANRERADTSVLVRGGVIEALGPAADLERLAGPACQVLDASNCVVIPGLINTHHHMFQNLTRAVPAAQDASLFEWLEVLYPIWAKLDPDAIRVSTAVALGELALSGCTTSADHLYLFPNGARLDDSIDAALEMGLRMHATRGALSVGRSAGGLPPDSLTEREPDILTDCIRLIDRYHNPGPGAMIRVGIAPCSPFSVSRELMRDAAELARDQAVMLHTHLAENDDDVRYSERQFGCRPGQYAEDLGWTGDDVWHAHCVKLDGAEIDLFAASGTGVAHCPASNMRLGSGIAPVRQMRDRGVKVGLGVDGSASNDAADLLAEARQAMLLQRVAGGAGAMTAREALEIATVGGARVLGRTDIGHLAPGMRADLAIYDLSGLAGAWDPVAALVLCGPIAARHTLVEGRFVVRDGQLVTCDWPSLLEIHRRHCSRLTGRPAQTDYR